MFFKTLAGRKKILKKIDSAFDIVVKLNFKHYKQRSANLPLFFI